MEIGIKFKCSWIEGAPLPTEKIKEINYWRKKIYLLNLIGKGKDGVGFGNISQRYRNDEFIISGAATGLVESTTNEHFSTVTSFDIMMNSLNCRGPIIASSEAMTHGVVYRLNGNINAVVHVHHHELWKKCLGKMPTTQADVEYGTPAMALEIVRLYKESDFAKNKMLVMAGHQDGLLSFGNNLREASEVVINLMKALL
ncbi:MAG: class II aldolase/adducin family protein [bacterium]|nr:class II aldolase/adducin family protein [bacterium]